MIQRISSPVAHRRGRFGFTLIEVLVVITIIAIIAGMSMGVYFRVRKSQVQSASETTVNKLASNLDQQWKAVLDNAKDDARNGIKNVDLYANQWATATGPGSSGTGVVDPRLELVIHSKMLQKLEFPQTFWEAVLWPGIVNLQLKSSYVRQITAQVTPASIQAAANGLTSNQMLQESAVLLYISSTQGRRGMAAFNATDAVGPFAVGTTTLYHYPNNPTYPVFIDNWGQPIAFIRWPTGALVTHELNDPAYPYATFTTFNTLPPLQAVFQGKRVRIDPTDPEAALFLGDWSTNSKTQFQNAVHKLPQTFDAMLNLSPFLISAGPDKQLEGSITDYGIGADFTQTGSQNEFDNLYSYRTRGMGRR